VSPVFSGSKNKPRKMEKICSSETSVEFIQTIRHYIPEDRALSCTVDVHDYLSPNFLSVEILS
jgi:hypothetical protein